jgi:O-antigen/teichoic acid export membrane protein
MTNPRIRTLINITWLIVERLARLAAGLAVGVVVARHLGPAGYGKISYVQAVVAVVASIAGMGLEPILMKELIAGKRPPHLTYSTVLGITGAASVAVALIGLGYSVLFVADQELRVLFLIAFSCLPIQTASIISVPLQAQEKFALLVRHQLIQIGIAVALRVLLVRLDASLPWFMFAFAVDASVWLLLLLRLTHHDALKFQARHVTLAVARKLTAAAAPLFATNLVVMLQIRIDQMMLGLLASAAAVGNFSVASKVAEGLMMAPSIVVRALNPQLLHAKARSARDFQACLRRQYDLSVMIAILIALLVSIASELLTRVLFGAAFADAALPLAILSWTIVPMTIGSVNANATIADGQTKQTLIKAACGLGLNGCLNYLLIPRFGAAGSALATLASHVCSAYLGMLIFKQQRLQFIYASKALLIPITIYRYRNDIMSLLPRTK